MVSALTSRDLLAEARARGDRYLALWHSAKQLAAAQAKALHAWQAYRKACKVHCRPAGAPPLQTGCGCERCKKVRSLRELAEELTAKALG